MTKPLVPEDLPRFTSAARENTIATFVRATIAVGMGKLDRNVGPEAYARKTWPGDRNVETVLRAATAPATIATSGPLAQVVAAFLPALTPVSAGADLLQRALGLSFDGYAQINIPSIGPLIADFVAEGAPIPVQQAATSPGTSLSPHKLAVITSLTSEMMRSGNAEQMVRQVMIESTGPAIDRNLFSANAGDSVRPAGLLHGVAPLTPAGPGEKASAMVDDLAALAAAVAPVSGNSQLALIAAPAQAVAISLRAPRELAWPLLTSAGLAANTVIAIALPVLIAAVSGTPAIDAGREVAMHMSTTPSDIVGSPTAVATPVISTYQTDSVALRLRWPLSWTVRDVRGVAFMTGVNW
jgi:hypothetical protein